MDKPTYTIPELLALVVQYLAVSIETVDSNGVSIKKPVLELQISPTDPRSRTLIVPLQALNDFRNYEHTLEVHEVTKSEVSLEPQAIALKLTQRDKSLIKLN